MTKSTLYLRGVRRTRIGFTTVELVVALAIMAFLVLQSMSLLASQQQNFHSQERLLSAQEDSRLAAELMLTDIRMAGFMVANFAGISSRDGGAANADVLCVSDQGAFDQTKISQAMNRFDRAELAIDLSAGQNSVTIQATHADVDDDGDDDFVVDQCIIISDGSATHCAHVTSVNPTSIGFTPAAPAGFLASAPSARAIPANIYQLNGLVLERNRERLTGDVEDLQIEFGIDADDDGLLSNLEFPIDDISAADTTLLRAVRLSILVRTAREDLAISGAGRQQVANRVEAGVADSFRRRLAVFQVAPRNML